MFKIRRFSAGDSHPVEVLITSIMNEEFHQDKKAYPIDDIKSIHQSYGDIGEAFFVAIDGEKIVGTVGVKKEDDRVALMRRLFVAIPYRKRRIGQQLIDRVFQFCKEVGYQEIVFKTTSRMEGAIKLCQKCGFVPRAKLKLGEVELLKFALSLRDGSKVQKI